MPITSRRKRSRLSIMTSVAFLVVLSILCPLTVQANNEKVGQYEIEDTRQLQTNREPEDYEVWFASFPSQGADAGTPPMPPSTTLVSGTRSTQNTPEIKDSTDTAAEPSTFPGPLVTPSQVPLSKLMDSRFDSPPQEGPKNDSPTAVQRITYTLSTWTQTHQPTNLPTTLSSELPTASNSAIPSSELSTYTSAIPSSELSLLYSSAEPTDLPTLHPSTSPGTSDLPSQVPSSNLMDSHFDSPPRVGMSNDSPTEAQSISGTMVTANPTDQPTNLQMELSSEPSATFGSAIPSSESSMYTSAIPSDLPSETPSSKPSGRPSQTPSQIPTMILSESPSVSKSPSRSPSQSPTGSTLPSVPSSALSSLLPSDSTTDQPTNLQTELSSELSKVFSSAIPSSELSTYTSAIPSDLPSESPATPTGRPSQVPSQIPTVPASESPSVSKSPSRSPSQSPTGSVLPSVSSSALSSLLPSDSTTDQPTNLQSIYKSIIPSDFPSDSPSSKPSSRPSQVPSQITTVPPSYFPSDSPSQDSSEFPSGLPSESPSTSTNPSHAPSQNPTGSIQPSVSPSALPSLLPSGFPTELPSSLPSDSPSHVPSQGPSAIPSGQPSELPSALPSQSPTDASFDSSTFYVIADTPYTEEERLAMPKLISSISDDALFAIHLGDIIGQEEPCNNETLGRFASYLEASPIPFFIVPGDNEVADCGTSNKEREAAMELWRQHFVRFDTKYWNHTLDVKTMPGRPESFTFEHKGTLFIGLNIVGLPRYNKDEWRERLSTQADWTIDLIEQRRDEDDGIGAIVIMAHAQLRERQHRHFLDPLLDYIDDDLDNEIPVLYVQGDVHSWAYDKEYKDMSSLVRVRKNSGTVDPATKIITHPTRSGVEQRREIDGADMFDVIRFPEQNEFE